MVEITLEQLKDILQIIDCSCQRGTFKAIEIQSIGKLYMDLLQKLENEKNNFYGNNSNGNNSNEKNNIVNN